jgi:uncharacterized protein (TIGR03437 family)
VTVFGTELARSEQGLTAGDIRDNTLPTELNFTRVYMDNIPVPLLYVGQSQINFMIPSKQLPGRVRVRVVRQGQTGPEVMLTVAEAAPALFAMPGGIGFAIATHGEDGTLITPEQPARGGETIVIWATGLGKTTRNPNVGEIPAYAAEILDRKERIAISPNGRVVYAGLTPGSAGLYQINMVLPSSPGIDPELRVTVGGVSSAPGLKLAVR